MRPLVIAGPGEWRRSTGEIVSIVLMTYPHLQAARMIVRAKIAEIDATIRKVEALQAEWKTKDTDQGRAVMKELCDLYDRALGKLAEMDTEIADREDRSLSGRAL